MLLEWLLLFFLLMIRGLSSVNCIGVLDFSKFDTITIFSFSNSNDKYVYSYIFVLD